jgi:hypothetical protein
MALQFKNGASVTTTLKPLTIVAPQELTALAASLRLQQYAPT